MSAQINEELSCATIRNCSPSYFRSFLFSFSTCAEYIVFLSPSKALFSKVVGGKVGEGIEDSSRCSHSVLLHQLYLFLIAPPSSASEVMLFPFPPLMDAPNWASSILFLNAQNSFSASATKPCSFLRVCNLPV